MVEINSKKLEYMINKGINPFEKDFEDEGYNIKLLKQGTKELDDFKQEEKAQKYLDKFIQELRYKGLGTELIDKNNQLDISSSLYLMNSSCPVCGSDLYITSSIKRVVCSNDFCPLKIANKGVSFLKKIGFLGIGESTMLQIVMDYDLHNPVELFMCDPNILMFSEPDVYYNKQLSYLFEYLSLNNEVTLADYLTLASMDQIEKSTAQKLSKPYQTLYEMYEDLFVDPKNYQYETELKGYLKIKSLLGLNRGYYSKQTMNVYNQLVKNRDYLLAPLDRGRVVMKRENKDKPLIVIAISGTPNGSYGSKPKFQEYLQYIFKDKYRFEFKNSVTKQVDYVVGSESSTSSKIEKAKKYEIPVIEATDLEEQLSLN